MDFIEFIRSMVPLAEEIVSEDKDALKLFHDAEGEDYRPVTLSPTLLYQTSEAEKKSLLDLYVMGAFSIAHNLSQQGVKILNIPEEYTEGLLSTDVNLTLDDYRQPFEEQIIRIPDNFWDFITDSWKERNQKLLKLKYIVVTHTTYANSDKKYLRCIAGGENFFNQNRATLLHLGKINTNIKTIEELLRNQMDVTNYEELKGMTEENYPLLTRFALNACLLSIDNTKAIGYKNPDYVNKMQESLKKAKKMSEKAKKSIQSQIQFAPFILTIKQQTVTHYNNRQNDSNGTSGIIVKPHHRRGCWRKQWFGPKTNQSNKYVWIQPVFVNKHLFQGKMLDTVVNIDLNTPIERLDGTGGKQND